MAGGVAPRVISDSIIFYLDAGNTKSKIPGDIYWKDLGRKQYGFTLSTTAGYSATPSSNGRYITNGGSASFCISESAFALPSQVTYNFWTRLGPSDAYIFSDNGQSLTGGHVWIQKSGNQLGIGYSSGSFYTASYASAYFTGPGSDTSFYDNEWVNTTYTVDYSNPSNSGLYRNGVLFVTQSLTTSNPPGIPVPRTLKKYIGNYGNNLTGTKGDISIVQLYNRILSAAEIKRNYDAMQPRHSNKESITTNGLQLYLDAADRSSYPKTGAVWSDLSPNGYTFSLVGAAYNNLNKGSINFNGTSNYVTRSTPFALYNQTSYTFWEKSGTASGSIQTFIGDSGQSVSEGYVFIYRLNGQLIVQYAGGTNWYSMSSANFFVEDLETTWVNATITIDYDNKISKFYKNGILRATFSMNETPIPPRSRSKYIGVYTPGAHYFKGNIAMFAIYNKILTDSEVYANYMALRLRYV